MAVMLGMVREQLDELLLEIIFKYLGLPYLFVSYKLHKQKYWWILPMLLDLSSSEAAFI